MSLRSKIVAQLKRPRGQLGRLAGFVMAHRPSNLERNCRTVDLLALESHHRVLEIGCGPGIALKACASKLKTGRAVGIDHSEVMIDQARKGVVRELKNGKVELRLGGLGLLEGEPPVFDRAFSLNVVQFFPDMDYAFACIVQCLVEGGLSATTYQPRGKKPTREAALAMASKTQSSMERSGFCDIEVHELPLKPVPAVSVTGLKGRRVR